MEVSSNIGSVAKKRTKSESITSREHKKNEMPIEEKSIPVDIRILSLF
jgi:hypothetical protein